MATDAHPTPTRITATEAARNFSDLLNRVRYRGESFTIERSGEVVAEISPPASAKRRSTGAELAAFFRNLPPVDPDWADDLQKVIDSQPVEIPRDPWES
jgi:antitoxin (DNA-binding transcriptional repressor) of toxin-antitoxin stability system